MDSHHNHENFPEFLFQCKTSTAEKIHHIFIQNNEIFNNIPSIGSWLSHEMEDFACAGKMLRGALAQLGFKLCTTTKDKIHDDVALLAAGLELLQAGLLVHDDIMDHDERRRGKPTCHISIAHRISAQKPHLVYSRVLQAAEAQGICVGDMFFFIAWKELASISGKVSSLIAYEHASVTLAQMRDVELGHDATYPHLSDVLEMYRLKTARYTVVLPLLAGAQLSLGQKPENSCGMAEIQCLQKSIESFGEAMGIVFQLQDDRLGLFGNEKELGKPIGSDIKEGKKTPYILSLLPKLTPEERDFLLSFFGYSSLREEDIEWLRSVTISHGVDAEMLKLIHSYTEKARDSLEIIAKQKMVRSDAIQILEDFITYSSARSS